MPHSPPAAPRAAALAWATALGVGLGTAFVDVPLAAAPEGEFSSATVRIAPSASLWRRPHDKWREACEALAVALRVGGAGAWGSGPFAEATCAEKPEPPSKTTKAVTAWRLEVAAAKGGGLSFALQSAAPGTTPSKLRVAKAEAQLELLATPELARRVVATLLDALAFRWQIPSDALESDGAAATPTPTLTFSYPALGDDDLGEDEATPPAPPARLALYRLAWDEGAKLWRPNVVGHAKQTAVTLPTGDTAGRVVYSVEASAAKAVSGAALWAHDAEGAGRRGEAWTKATAAAWGLLAEAQAERMATPLVASRVELLGFVGLRYGVQLLKGDALLEKTSFFGLLLEVRSGPLRGVQYYYDKLPLTAYTEDTITGGTVDADITWARHVLGYAFAFDFPWIFDRLTLAPKLGVWSLEARIPANRDDAGRAGELRRFGVKNAVSLGIEGGAEALVSRFALRPWLGIDTGYSPFGDGKRVTSRRFGLDVYAAGPSFTLFGAPVRVALLGFGFLESVTLASDKVDAEGDETLTGGIPEVTARRIEYNAGYGGLGAALSW